MPGLNRCAGSAEPISFDEFVARLDEDGAEMTDPADLDRLAGLMERLWANRSFLVDAALAALAERCATQTQSNGYGGQVLLLHRVPGRYFIRANFWPSLDDDPVARASGRGHYSYDLAHDHNFDFLTLGYLGPGYRSDWYEYDHDTVAGYTGEPVKLTLSESGQLAPGRILHYRAHRDVHCQMPPDSLSVSINIVPESPDLVWRDQYVFDMACSAVAAIQTAVPTEALVRLAVHFGDGNGTDLAMHLAQTHPSHRLRWAAWRALAGVAETIEQRHDVLTAATRSDSALVIGEARRALRRIDAMAGR